MAVFKDNWNGYEGKSWRVFFRYKDWQGKKRQHSKRGFATRKEAIAYEREFLEKKSKNLNMKFSSFIELYLKDLKPQIKLNTYYVKTRIIKQHILPYFEDKELSDISPSDILQWQNEILSKRDDEGKGYSQTYLRTIQAQLSSILNHAVNYYELKDNPCKKSKAMGKSKAKEMLFWTIDEYKTFAEAMKEKPVSYYAFETLFWTGIRLEELLALEKGDIDLERRTLKINKQLQTIDGKKYITSPKTEKGNRVIELPKFLCREYEDYFEMFYKMDEHTRIFTFSRAYLHHEMDRGVRKTGVKRIRIHDLRHSACAALIRLGFSPLEIADRLGHESATITLRYAHLYPTVQRDMANKLDEMFEEGENHE